MTVAATLADVLALFEGLGLRATSDPRSLNPPGVLVALPTVRPRLGKACVDVDLTAYLVAANSGSPASVTNLSDLLDVVLAAGLVPFTEAVPYDLTLPGGGDPAPAFRLQWSTTVPR